MFRSQSSDHHQGVNHRTCAITTYRRACLVVFWYVAVCCLCVCAYGVPVRVVSGVHKQTPHGQVHRMHRRTDNIQPHTGIRRGMHADK